MRNTSNFSAIIIPARYGSSRLEGKPLLKACNKPIIQWVWEKAKAVPHVDRVIIATDDDRIFNACKKFCAEKQIEYHVIPVKEAYKKFVMDYFKSEYRRGRTPNPCIMCNPNVKFGALLDGVDKLGIKYDYFCTGHYARLVRTDFDVAKFYNETEDKNQEYTSKHIIFMNSNFIKKQQHL